MPQPDLTDHFTELIRRASTVLPSDVGAAIRAAADHEDEGSVARRVLLSLLENAAAAARESSPICQDTGTLTFHVTHDAGFSRAVLEDQIREAVAEATRRSFLRPNAVNALTGKNSGNNLGTGAPLVFFHDAFGRSEAADTQHSTLSATLLLKGGGSENVSIQYSLPDERLGAGRDYAGVRRCILDAVHRAQGYGCAPGTLGIGIGGDRMTSHMTAKEQLLRRLDDVNPDPDLAAHEKEAVEKLNTLGIGPMGFGGRTTVLGVKIGARHRVPASFFVSIAYMCWAFRRCTMTWKDGTASFES
ncbi:MAG: fumarate hydratase [Deltaproteobacteria bacterium]|nr:fumarate hydratase [Deltaproteobacteria bacterium]